MKRILISLISVLSLVCLILTACSSKKPSGNTDDTEQPNENALVHNGVAVYSMVRPDNCSKELTSAIAGLRTYIETTSGFKIDLGTDWTNDGKYDSSTKEILIGDTKYNESTEAKSALGDNTFAIVKKGNKIVVVGVDDQAVINALNYFKANLISMDIQKGIVMYTGNDFYYNETEAINNLKINGVPFADYKILYVKDNQESEAYAQKAQQSLKDRLSYSLPTVDVASAGENNIIFSFSNHPSYTAADYMHYDIHVDGSNLIVSTGGYYSLERLLMNFADTLFKDGIFDLKADFSVSGNYFDANAYDIPQNADVRMISANILAEYAEGWGSTIDIKYRTEIFAGNMNFYGADVIGIQECSPLWLEFFENDYTSPYKILGKPSVNYFTYILYNTETLDVLEYGYRDFSVKNNLRARGIAYGVFRDKESGKVFAFGSTHWNGGDTDDCRTQVNEAAKVLNDLKAKYNCTIYCTGDFNSNENTGVYKTFMELTAMEDTMYSTVNRTNNLASWHDLGKEDFSVNSCDHIFASKGVECLKFRTLAENSQIYASDHSWLCADIVLP